MHPQWLEMRQAKRMQVALVTETGDSITLETALTTDRTSFGERWWFQCHCGARRKFLHLRAGELQCRRCHRLLYLQQRLPQTRWRDETGRVLLKAARMCRG
jgi:hypothetical protein